MTDGQVTPAAGGESEGVSGAPEGQEAGGTASGAARFVTLDDLVKQRRQQYRAEKAAKQEEKGAGKNKKIIINVKSAGAKQSPVQADNVVLVYNLPAHTTEEKMQKIVKDAVFIQPSTVALGNPIKVGFADKTKAAEFAKYMNGLFCEETNKDVVAKLKSNSITLVRKV